MRSLCACASGLQCSGSGKLIGECEAVVLVSEGI